MSDLYDIFSPVALRGRSVLLLGPSGPLAGALQRTFTSVGATVLTAGGESPPDILLLVEPGPAPLRLEARPANRRGISVGQVSNLSEQDEILLHRFSPGLQGPRHAAVCLWHDAGGGATAIRSLAAELAPARVNGVAFPAAFAVPEGTDPLEEAARAALFMACPASQCLHGAVLELGPVMVTLRASGQAPEAAWGGARPQPGSFAATQNDSGVPVIATPMDSAGPPQVLEGRGSLGFRGQPLTRLPRRPLLPSPQPAPRNDSSSQPASFLVPGGVPTTGPRSPLGLYDTFSPTVLKGRVALVDGAADDLTAAVTLELARSGARVAVCAPPGPPLDAAIKDARAMGRDVRRLDTPGPSPTDAARGAVAQAVEAFARLDLLVNTSTPGRGAYFTRAAAPHLAGGPVVNLVTAATWSVYPDGGMLREALSTEAGRSRVRINAIGLDGRVAPQQAAWVAVFLASDAGRAISGQCFPLTG